MGHQPPGSRVQNMQKKHPAQSPVGHAAHIQKQLPANQHIVGLTANTKKEMNLDQPINCLTANLGQDVDNVQPGNRCRTSVREELPAVQPIIGLREVSHIGPCQHNYFIHFEVSLYHGSKLIFSQLDWSLNWKKRLLGPGSWIEPLV